MKNRSMRLARVVGMTLWTLSAMAHASLELVEPGEISGAGLGNVHTVLTIQSPGSSDAESGSIGIDEANQVLVSGDAKTGSSQSGLVTFEEAGIGSASELVIVFNANEPRNGAADSITLTNLVLDIYDEGGDLLYTSGHFAPTSFASTFSGTGTAGFVFALAPQGAERAQDAAFTGDFSQHRIGLSASATGATGGFETFFVASVGPTAVPAIPEPQTYALLLAGLGMVLFVSTRSRQRRL